MSKTIKTSGNYMVYRDGARVAGFALEDDRNLFQSAPELLEAAQAAQAVLKALCNWIAEDPNAQHYEDCDPDGSQGCTCPISSAPDARSRLGSAIAKAEKELTG